MNKKYGIEINNAIKYEILEKNNIYDFREINTDLKYHFSKYYQFCRNALDKHSDNIKITPNFFVYNENITSNASAGYNGQVFFISINKGMIKKCYDNFIINEKLNLYIEDKFAIVNRFDEKISKLGFKIASRFTFYHELAHLFQFSKKNQVMTLDEQVSVSPEYSSDNHYLEIDADTFATLMITYSIVEYMDKHIGEELNQDNVKDVPIVLGVCLLHHIANFSDNVVGIYFKEKKHPHPFLRILNIIINLANALSQYPYFKDKKIKIDYNETFNRIINLYQEMEEQKIFDTNLFQSIERGRSFQQEIKEYLGSLVERRRFPYNEYNSALDMYNHHIAS